MQMISGNARIVRLKNRVGRKRRRQQKSPSTFAPVFLPRPDAPYRRPASLVDRPPLPGVTPPTTFVPYSAQPLA